MGQPQKFNVVSVLYVAYINTAKTTSRHEFVLKWVCKTILFI